MRATDRMRAAMDDFETALRRMHPETVTPMQWITIRQAFLDVIESSRLAADAIENLTERAERMEEELTWLRQSATSLFDSTSNKPKPS